jgi:hypothetical protein
MKGHRTVLRPNHLRTIGKAKSAKSKVSELTFKCNQLEIELRIANEKIIALVREIYTLRGLNHTPLKVIPGKRKLIMPSDLLKRHNNPPPPPTTNS